MANFDEGSTILHLLSSVVSLQISGSLTAPGKLQFNRSKSV